MTGSILQALNQNMQSPNPAVSRLKQLTQTLKSAKNPKALMAQMMQNNPNMQRVQQLIQQNNGDARQAFYSLAGQMGMDPNDVLSLIQ